MDDVVDRLRVRTIPSGYIPHPWTPGYSCRMAARGLRGMHEWRRYIDHEGGARVGL